MKVCIVQPVQSPYWTERIVTMSRDEDLAITLVLERAGFKHRPGWEPVAVAGVGIQILNSAVFHSSQLSADLGYRSDVLRSVAWRLPFALWRLRPDVVIVVNATQLALALSVRRILGFRIGLIVEDTIHATRRHGRVRRAFRGWVYRRADRFFPFSDDAAAYLGSIGVSGAISRSSWSVDMEQFGGRFASHDRKEGRSLNKRLIVLFSGRLVEGKGVWKLLDAWAGMDPDRREEAELVIAGDGPLRAAAEAYCRHGGLEEVKFLGAVAYKEMKELFSCADLFVLPTFQDLFSLTVLEAMASGCPVITTPFNGAQELVEEGKTGWIVDPTESGALTRTLEAALFGEFDLAGMGRAARERVAVMDNELVMSRFVDDLRVLAREHA